MYEHHFGLSDKPFRLTPDARFFYPSDQHRRALAFLEYGLHEGEGFIVITGEPGTGKSTLVSKLMDEHAQDKLKVASIETSRLTDEHLLEMLLSRFDLKMPRLGGKAGMLETLRKGFLAWEKRGIRALAIIDEAQNLPSETVEELRMLSNLTTGQKPLLQTFLVGQSALRTRIETPEFEQLRQRITASFHLGPFKPDEVQPYIEYRLTQVGWRQRPQFEPEAFDALHRSTGGVPRMINMLCDRVLLYCYLEEDNSVTAETVDMIAKETGIRPPDGIIMDGEVSERLPMEASHASHASHSGHSSHSSHNRLDGSDGVALVSELIERLRGIENRIQYTERRLRLELSMLRKMISNRRDPQEED